MKSTRREFLTAAGMTAAGAMVGADGIARGAGGEDKRKPNLLIIQTDEHHFNTLGCYGGTIVETPNIDWLAANGALCTGFYATTPVCSPSRAAFVTGRYPQNTPVVTNNIPLDGDCVTFAHVLAQQGYATGYAGKWHLDGTGRPQWAPERDFGFADNRYMFNRGHWKQMELTPDGPRVAARNAKGGPTYAVEGADEESFTTDWLATRAIEFVESQKNKPFCYMVSSPDPHGPNTVRPPYDTMYDDVDVPIPASLDKTDEQTPAWAPRAKNVTHKMLRRIMPPYYGMVKCIDDNVGRILGALRHNGLIENTIVVFTADHGDLCGEHGRLNKGVPYEGSAKVPFVIYCPGKIEGGRRVGQALSCVDFQPTVLSLMGFAGSGEEQGRDASALFAGPPPSDWNDVAFVRSTPGNPWLCAVTDDCKLVVSPREQPWLFDLKNDPQELRNVYGDAKYAEVVQRLTRDLREYCARFGDPYGEFVRRQG